LRDTASNTRGWTGGAALPSDVAMMISLLARVAYPTDRVPDEAPRQALFGRAKPRTIFGRQLGRRGLYAPKL
jgi:hypothetical protein